MVEAALLVGLLGLLILGITSLLLRSPDHRRAFSVSGRWRVTHYDARQETHVVVQKVSEDGRLLDEHLVAAVRTQDPEYDAKFLAAMSAARERQALFESEEGE